MSNNYSTLCNLIIPEYFSARWDIGGNDYSVYIVECEIISNVQIADEKNYDISLIDSLPTVAKGLWLIFK